MMDMQFMLTTCTIKVANALRTMAIFAEQVVFRQTTPLEPESFANQVVPKPPSRVKLKRRPNEAHDQGHSLSNFVLSQTQSLGSRQ